MKISPFVITFLAMCALISAKPIPEAGAPAIEIIPIAVWQGKTTRPWSMSLLRDVRNSIPGNRVAHAISAAPLARNESSRDAFRSYFSEAVQAGDDILLHMAPWKSLADKASVAFKYSPTIFGAPIVADDCASDCGLDLSFSAFSRGEVRSMISMSQELLTAAGFGKPEAVYFDEGVTSASTRLAGRSSGISQDWSGIEMTQFKGALGRFPFFKWNQEQIESLAINNFKETQNDGLLLDHVRFAVHAEIGDMESTAGIIKAALAVAKSESRIVRLPIVFNVEDLIYTQGFVTESVATAYKMAQDDGVPIAAWPTMNKSWSFDKIRVRPSTAAVVSFAPPVSVEAEFLPEDETIDLMSMEPAVQAH